MTICKDPNAWVSAKEATPALNGQFWASHGTAFIYKVFHCLDNNCFYRCMDGVLVTWDIHWYCDELEDQPDA